MALFDSSAFNTQHRIPIGKIDGQIIYKYVMALKIDINSDINGEFSLEFLDNLPEYYKIQIGDTFYQKRPSEFVYDYLNQSEDYKKELDDLVYEEIWIWREF